MADEAEVGGGDWPAVRLESERLILRDWRGEEDWRQFFRHTNTPAVMRWLGGVYGDEYEKMQVERVRSCAARHGHCFWLVERKADGGHLSGELLGFCGLKRADAPASTVSGEFEIGWRFREDSWGRGYAKEAAMTSLDAAFERFGAPIVHALTVIGNEASWGLMRRIGMTRREDLDYVDDRFPDADPPIAETIVYSITRDEWAKARD